MAREKDDYDPFPQRWEERNLKWPFLLLQGRGTMSKQQSLQHGKEVITVVTRKYLN